MFIKFNYDRSSSVLSSLFDNFERIKQTFRFRLKLRIAQKCLRSPTKYIFIHFDSGINTTPIRIHVHTHGTPNCNWTRQIHEGAHSAFRHTEFRIGVFSFFVYIGAQKKKKKYKRDAYDKTDRTHSVQSQSDGAAFSQHSLKLSRNIINE